MKTKIRIDGNDKGELYQAAEDMLNLGHAHHLLAVLDGDHVLCAQNIPDVETFAKVMTQMVWAAFSGDRESAVKFLAAMATAITVMDPPKAKDIG